jgi:hypothetical protein
LLKLLCRRCRLQVLIALCTVDDKATRLAASGALATLAISPRVARAIAVQERGVPILLELIEENDQGLQHRGLEVLKHVVHVGGSIIPAETKAKLKGVLETRSKEGSVTGETARETLAALR